MKEYPLDETTDRPSQQLGSVGASPAPPDQERCAQCGEPFDHPNHNQHVPVSAVPTIPHPFTVAADVIPAYRSSVSAQGVQEAREDVHIAIDGGGDVPAAIDALITAVRTEAQETLRHELVDANRAFRAAQSGMEAAEAHLAETQARLIASYQATERVRKDAQESAGQLTVLQSENARMKEAIETAKNVVSKPITDTQKAAPMTRDDLIGAQQELRRLRDLFEEEQRTAIRCSERELAFQYAREEVEASLELLYATPAPTPTTEQP